MILFTNGINKFAKDAAQSGANGIIVPDVPIDEYKDFFQSSFDDLEIILLATPTTSEERIKKIDEKSRGFLYYVSMTGTTGGQISHNDQIMNSLKKVSSIVKHNPLLIGFGISTVEDIKKFSPYCSGVIVGSAVIKSLMNENGTYDKTLELVKNLKQALKD